MIPQIDWATSGDAEIDAVRRELPKRATSAENFPHRLSVLTTWVNLLQRQGADLSGYAPHFDALKAAGRSGDMTDLGTAIERAYTFLGEIQNAMLSANSRVFSNLDAPSPVPGSAVNWAVYGGNPQHTASTDAPGPVRGEIAWQKAVGLGWTARPAVEQGRVYAAVPGIRSFLTCLDLDTGMVIWKTRRLWTRDSLGVVNLLPSSYVLPGAASVPLVSADSVIVNQLGAQGRNYGARHLLVIDKASGQITAQIPAGQADYRIGHAALAGSDRYWVCPTGTQRIKDRPPQVIAQNRLLCLDAVTGETRWDFHIGPTFCEPLVDGDQVLIGTAAGMLFCLNLSGGSGADHFGFSDEQRVSWSFRAQGAVNSAVEVYGTNVFFGDNTGMFSCLDRRTGELIWETAISHKEPRSFRLFSRPTAANGRVYVGTAGSELLCFDASTGVLCWSLTVSDWIRACPRVRGHRVLFATLDGWIGCVDDLGDTGDLSWRVQIGTHPIYADLVEAEDRLLVTASDLSLWCLDAVSGATLWRHALLDRAEVGGRVYAADELACGGWYQSKPTAAEGRIFIGTPSHFVFALDPATGDELWRFEVGGAVSAAPAFADGRIFFGQQGGEEDFYCLDAATGHLLWKQMLGWVWSSANVVEDRVFVSGVDGMVSALDARSGHILWRGRTGSSTAPEPPVDDGMVFFGSWDHYVYAFDTQTGSLLWQFHTGGSPDSGAPIVHAGRLYVPMGGKRLCCLDAPTGRLLWEFRVTEGDLNASPALWRGRLFVSISLRPGAIPIAAEIHCLDAETGKPIWRFPAGGGITGPAVADGRVYFGSTADPYFTCVDAEGHSDGTTRALWRCEMGERVYESVPAIYDGRAYILSENGFLYAFV